MTNKFNYPQGSIWRKWDLHVHTKSDIAYKYSSDNKLAEREKNDNEYPNVFIKHIYSIKDLGAIAITDHDKGDWLDKILEENSNHISSQAIKEPIAIFPGVEIETGDGIHLLVIFNPETQIVQVKNNFRKDTWKDTISHFITAIQNPSNPGSKKTTEEILEEAEKWDAICIFAHVTSNKGFFKISSGDRKNKIYKHPLSQIFQVPNSGIQDVGISSIINGNDPNYGNKPVTIITASDARKLLDIGQNNCWIKADPTFEGLKQILYEPEERVRIQEENPEYEFDKPTFSKIIINSPVDVFQNEKVKFNQQEIPLNKNLVTIIGGRGGGKSLLLNYIANTFNKPILAYQKRKEDQTQFNNSENFIIEWQKNNNLTPETITLNCKDKGQLDFIFIEQGKLKNISDYKILAEEIKTLLSIEKLQFDTKLDSEILQLLNEIQEIKNWFEYENEQKEKINSREFNQQKKNKAENLLKTITTEENKQKLQKYTSNISEITECEKLLSRLQELKETLAKRESELNEVINVINAEIGVYKFQEEIPKIDFKSQNERIKNIESKLVEILQNKKNENETIKKAFEEQGFKGDLETLLSNAEKYQKNIQEAESQLKEIEHRKKLLDEKLQERNKLADKLKDEYERLKNEIDNAWNNILNRFNGNQKKIIEKLLTESNVSICGKIYFDLKKFDEKLREYLDQRKYKNLLKDIGIENLEDYWNFIKNDLKDYIEGDKRETTKKRLEELFLYLKERRDYLYVIPEIKFRGKTLDKLSVGQRGTLYVLLQLATNTFSSPLVFDQPEDDLDNEFIVKELVNLFKELKKYRQLIIATHNANLVVTADAEQIIVAQNEDETLTYSTGALENPDIINSVCTILEGGKEAFEKREKKYGFR